MNKFFFVLYFLFCSFLGSAQDTLPLANITIDPPKISTFPYKESDIQVDSSALESKHFSKNFKKKYTGSDFVYEYKVPEKNFWDHFKEWLASILRNIFTFDNPQTSLSFVATLLKIIAVVVVVIVIYLIVKVLIGKEGNWIFSKNANKKIVYYTDLEKNIHLLDFKKLIEESIAKGEKRIAIRYYYLWLLKVMAQNHYIEWDIEKTNTDYLYELQKPAHREAFTYLSYLYNHIWYGEFEIDEATFQKTENRFKQSIKTFSNE